MSRSFVAAVAACPQLKTNVKRGLQALTKGDRARIFAARPRRITGSVNLDETLTAALPNEPRWDYGVGYQPAGRRGETVHWIEVHPATDSEVQAVERKLQWLKSWLESNAIALRRLECRYVWVSSGSTRLTPTSPALKRLAQKGCRNVGRTYRIT